MLDVPAWLRAVLSNVVDGARKTAVDHMLYLEEPMANKDKGGRSTKKAAAKDLKQKRLDKKNKRDEADRKSKGKLI